MFAKSRGSSPALSDLLPGSIRSKYEIGKQTATAGPENVWRIYDGYQKDNRMEVSIFLFDKRSVDKLYKPRRKEMVTDMLRAGLQRVLLEEFSHLKLLQAHNIEECAETLAFTSEPVIGSLANVLAYKEQVANSLAAASSTSMGKQQPPATTYNRTTLVKEYEMLDLEVKYGLLQITEALLYLHKSNYLHRNICPTSIIITKRGTWKLWGLEFMEKLKDAEPTAMQPWTKHYPKVTQPNLDYIAPEVQQKKSGSFSSDMYSFGMTICAIYNQGRPLIQANHSCSDYFKQLEILNEQVAAFLPLVPISLHDTVTRLLHKDPKQRPTPQILTMLNFFRDPVVHALQFLDACKMKEVHQKEHFYSTTLKELLLYIPKKLWYQHVWMYLHDELGTQEVLSAVLQPMLYIVQNSTKEEYDQIVYPTLKPLFVNRKSIQGTVTLLENLTIILEKTSREHHREVLAMLYTSFENSTVQVRTAAFMAVTKVTNYIDDDTIRNVVLPKLIVAFETNYVDSRLLMDVLPCMLNRLDKQKTMDYILPLLCKVKMQEPEVVMRVVNMYRLMLTDKKYGLSVNWIAAHAMPSLVPQTVNPALNLDQFEMVFAVLQDMLSSIERHQRNKLSLDNLSPCPDKYRPLRPYSTENVHAPSFNIPNLRVEQRKTSSAEDMARKNSIGSISTASAENMARKNSMAAMFGSWFTTSGTSDSNFLRVANTFTSRRLSDNTLMTPKIRIAPSCASSPGGTPGGGLPIRRHSSTGPQERRGSTINLSPPTGGGMPITSSSVPFLFSSSLNSIRGSRRPSVSSSSSQQGIGILQQVGSSMYQFFNRQPEA